jgi:hypothetical protein
VLADVRRRRVARLVQQPPSHWCSDRRPKAIVRHAVAWEVVRHCWRSFRGE